MRPRLTFCLRRISNSAEFNCANKSGSSFVVQAEKWIVLGLMNWNNENWEKPTRRAMLIMQRCCSSPAAFSLPVNLLGGESIPTRAPESASLDRSVESAYASGYRHHCIWWNAIHRASVVKLPAVTLPDVQLKFSWNGGQWIVCKTITVLDRFKNEIARF